jgi:phosphatidylglycerophosphate synthase
MTGSGAAHVRLNTGLLAVAEKRTLVWIAERLPPQVNSDHLTVLALVAMAGAGASFWAGRYWPAALGAVVACLAVNWFGDSLDGTLARVRRHERPRYGYYVDHVLDIVGACFLFGGIALSGFMTSPLALALLAAYLLVSAEVFLATRVSGTFRMSFLGIGPTELRIVLSIGALLLPFRPVVSPFGLGPFLLFDVGGIVAMAGLAVAFVTSTVRTTVLLYRAEPLRRVGTGAVLAIAALTAPGFAEAAELQAHTARAWNGYVAATEARIARELTASRGFLASDFSPEATRARRRVLHGEVVIARMRAIDGRGTLMDVQDGFVSHWRGSVFLSGVALDTLLCRLQHPERHAQQEDVLALRVLSRKPDHLRLLIRMTRRDLVRVTYDTEHAVDYRRLGSMRASSRSVATRIAELDGVGTGGEREKPPGEDRGFLWRLNSYWRYEQVGGGVLVELESLTLSRSLPPGLAVIARPIIDRIAAESITRTLEHVRQTYARARTSA